MKNCLRTASLAVCVIIFFFHTAQARLSPAAPSGNATDRSITLVQLAGAVCSGADAMLEASLPENSYTRYYFQLQKRAAGTEDWRNEGAVVNNGTSRVYTFTITGAQPGFEYRVLAARDSTWLDSWRHRRASAPLLLKVTGFTASIDSASTPTVCYGATALLQAAVCPVPGTDTVAGGYVYTWETSTDSSTGWSVVPGQTGPALLTDTLTADRYYRVTATANGCSGKGPSQAFKVTVRPAATANAGPDQTQYNSGRFTLAAKLPDTGTGQWSVVSGAADMADPADPATAVTIAANTSATLRWTITPGSPCLPASDEVVITYTQQADLVISKTGPADRAAGQAIAYRLVVTNNGPSDASGLRIQDVVPAAITGFNYTPSTTGAAIVTGSSRNGDTILLTGHLPAGSTDSIVLDINGTISPDAAAGTITSTATVTPPPGITETMPSTNTSRVNTNINTNVGLQISQSGPALANAGSPITYTVEVTNTGTTNAIGVILLNNVPADVTNVTWTATAIGNGSTTVSKTGGTGNGINLTANIEGTTSGPGKIVLTINGTVALDADTAITNIATLEYAGTRQSSFTTARNRSADLHIVKAGPATVSAGQRITYTLDVTNAGPADARGVTITDTVPALLSAVSWTAAATGSATVATGSGAGHVITLRADLPAGKDNSVRVTVSGVTAPGYQGAFTNTATAVPPPGNPDPTLASSSVTTQAALHYNLQVLQAGPAQVAAGQQLTYTVTVTNNGPSNAANIIISDTVPAQLQNVRWTAVASGAGTSLSSPASGSGRHILLAGRLLAGPGHQVALTITGTVNPAFTGAIHNTATATAPDGAAASSSVSTTVINSPGLEIVKSGPSNLNAGREIIYAIAVTNHGPSDARGITISDVVPPQVQHVRWTAIAAGPGAQITGDSSGTGNDVVINGDIAAGAGNRIDVIISGRVDPSFTGSIHNTASVQVGQQPPLSSTPVVTVVSRKTGLLISKSAPAAASANDSITYIIRVSNAGPSNAENAIITDQVPNGVSNIRWTAIATGNAAITSGAAGTGPAVAVAANIPAGADDGVIITITGRISRGYSGQLKNWASATLPNSPPVTTDTCITTVQRIADIRVVKSGPGSVLPGGTITYTIDVSNTGPGNADTVTVTDIVPAAITVHDWSVTTISGNSVLHSPASGTGNEVQVRAALENGAQIRITINGAVLPDAAGPVHNMAQAVLPPGTIDPGPGDTSSVTTEIPFIADPPSANLVVEKLVLSAAPYRIGQRVDYRITVRNEGPDTATGVQASDQFPAALGTPTTILTDKGEAQFDTGSRRLQWSIGALPAGDRANLTYHVQLTGDGTVQTRTVASGLETDPDTASNQSAISIPVSGDIFIPNVITPNGDGLNDQLVIPGLEKYSGSLLDIYNRWGNQVYHANDYGNSWTGAGLAEGTYYYILEVKKPEGVKVYKGWIQLLR